MPRSYVPTLMALQLPELLLALGLAGVVGAFVAATRRNIAVESRAMLVLVALAAIAPVLLTVIQRPAMYNSIRHFIFIIPPLAALGGLAGTWLLAQAQRIGTATTFAATAVLLAGLVLPVVEMVRLHPYQYGYFNRIAGGIKGADGRYMRDYWGLSFKQASQALLSALAARNETAPGGRPWRIAVCGPHPPAQIALGPRFTPTWDPRGADFAMILNEFYCAELAAPVLVEISREGVVYARVYDIRGRNFRTLFKFPPVEPDKE
jgi:hypothetical protein